MPENGIERRTAPRFVLSVPVSLESHTDEPTGIDMSADGIFFYTRSKLDVGTDIEFTAILPLEYVALPEIQVRYKGKVVRFEELSPGLLGVAVQTASHEVLVGNDPKGISRDGDSRKYQKKGRPKPPPGL